MSKIDINYGNLRYRCVQNLDDAISNLNKAITYYNQISIPRDFAQSGTLKNIANDILNCNKKISNIRKWVVNSNSDFDNLLQNLTDQANRMPINGVKIKNNNI